MHALVQVNSMAKDDPPPATEGASSVSCEVCTYMIQNHETGQPYLCRGLRAAEQQKAVSLIHTEVLH